MGSGFAAVSNGTVVALLAPTCAPFATTSQSTSDSTAAEHAAIPKWKRKATENQAFGNSS